MASPCAGGVQRPARAPYAVSPRDHAACGVSRHVEADAHLQPYTPAFTAALFVIARTGKRPPRAPHSGLLPRASALERLRAGRARPGCASRGLVRLWEENGVWGLPRAGGLRNEPTLRLGPPRAGPWEQAHGNRFLTRGSSLRWTGVSLTFADSQGLNTPVGAKLRQPT